MFVLTQLKDMVRTPPKLFDRKLSVAITDTLNKKYANKVILNVGLCIALHNIEKLHDSHIIPGDGAAYTRVLFSFVVFRPFIEEILEGKILKCTPEGVRVTLEFFDDIIIPAKKLQQPARYDTVENVWIWEYETEDGKTDLFMDPGETIRFRVSREIFSETTPCGPRESKTETDNSEANEIAPYVIEGSIDEQGLGLISWWSNS